MATEAETVDTEVRFLLDPPDVVAERFHALRDEWEGAAGFLSSADARAMLPAYQTIIGLGEDVVPLLVRDLAEGDGDWFWALKAITGEDPVPQADRGDVPLMTHHWLLWGRRKGLL